MVAAANAVAGMFLNLHPRNGDYEFGPLMAAGLMAAQAALGLVYLFASGKFSPGGGSSDGARLRE